MINDTPHSAVTRAKELERTKAKPNIYGTYRRPIAPTPHEAAVIRRISRGHLQVTISENKMVFHYEDGTPVRGFKGDFPLTKFVKQRWIVPITGETLFEDGTAQRYRVPAR